MNKTLLIISGGIEAVPGIKKAVEMGCHVVVSDRDPDAPGFEYAHDHILADTYGVEETLAAASKYHRQQRPIQGVMCMAADVPLTVATVANELGLPGIPISAALLASDKLAMKQCFTEKKITIPWFTQVTSDAHLKKVMSAQDRELIIKPVDSRGARGVLRIDRHTDLAWAYSHSLSYSPSGRVMVESFLEGPQISTETVLIDRKAATPGFADRNYEMMDLFKPYIIENGGQQPSALSIEEKEAVVNMAVKAALAMGITTGIAKGDMVMTSDGPAVIEIAARLSGGWFSTDQIPLATGIDLIKAAICVALDEPPCIEDLTVRHQKGVAIRYFFPPPGVVKEIRNVSAYEDLPWIHKLHFFVGPGDIVSDVTNHTQRAGFVITTAKDCKTAVERAESVVEKIAIITEQPE